MKKFTKYSIGRGLTKVIALSIMLFFAAAVAVCSIESFKASHSTGTEQAYHVNMSEKAGVVVLAVVLVTSLSAVRVGTFGFQKSRVFVHELGLHLTHPELALWNFLTRGENANQQIKQELLKGQLVIRGWSDYLRFIITGQTGNRDIFNSTVGWRQGRIPEIFGNAAQLAKGTCLGIQFVSAAYATDATATVPEADVDYSKIHTAWPAALANSEIVIHQNGIKDRFALKSCGTQANGFLSGIETDGYELPKMIVFEEEKPIKLEIKYAEGQTVSAVNNHFLELGFQGAIVTRKA